MRFVPSTIPEVILIEPEVHRDARGFFLETYHIEKYRAAGVADMFVQDNQSRSAARTVRGLHLQVRRPQGKLVRVVDGEIFDVAVDVRRGSPTFGTWVAHVLSSENFRLVYLPPGFAHGFAVLSAFADVEYKCTDVYDPAGEIGILWNDPTLAIEWPVNEPVLSDRDRHNPTLAEAMAQLPEWARV